MAIKPHEYNGRPVYSQDGFTRGTIVAVGLNAAGDITYAKIDLDEPNEAGETRVTWNWVDCKPA